MSKLRLAVQKRFFRYKLFRRQYNWMDHIEFVGAYPFFWLAKWRACFLMHYNPYAKVWIIPRGKPSAAFTRKLERFRLSVARWKFDPWEGR